MSELNIPKPATELAGKYYVAAELCRRGYQKVSLSSDAHPAVSAVSPRSQTQFSPKVNSVRDSPGWAFFVDEDTSRYPEICILVIVPIPPKADYQVYIVPRQDVDRLSKKARDEYLEQHPDAKKFDPMLGPNELGPYLGEDMWKLLPQ